MKRPSSWMLVLPLLFFLLIILLFKSGLNKDPNVLPSILVGKAVPAFTAPSLLNIHDRLASTQLKGRITLLNIWASWCSACRIEHPLLVDMASMYKLQLYGLNYKDQQHAALAYLGMHGNPYKNIIYDPQGKVAMQLGVYGTPETFLIDKKGIVRYRYVGPITLDILENDVLLRIKQIEQEN